jgi:ribose transport system substrate-binding protein
MIPIPTVHGADLAKWYEPCMTPDAVSTFPVPPSDPMPDALLGAYFRKPAAIALYNYADVPGACKK